LTVRAVFPNPRRVLLPGMNTRVRMTYEVAQNALLIPQKAVTELLGKYFATVVGAGNKTDLRPIRPGARIGDMWLIEDGLKAGDRIVVDGLQKAKAGTVITPLPLPAPAAPAAPAAAKS
jgi:membrane fusion protein (multidrug efflux system)